MTTQAESINSDLQRGLDRRFTTYNIEHGTEPDILHACVYGTHCAQAHQKYPWSYTSNYPYEMFDNSARVELFV